MRWNEPKEGETRTVVRFAWWPVRMDRSQEVVWLERYLEVQRYFDGCGWCNLLNLPFGTDSVDN